MLPMSCTGRNSGVSRKRPERSALNGQKIPPARAADAERRILRDGPERAIPRHKTTGGLLSEGRPCGRIDHQARLIAVLRGRRAGNDFHRLNRVGRNGRREDLVPLVRHRLAVDDIADLGVIAQRMEKSVRIGRDTRGGIEDRVVQPRVGRKRRQGGDQPPVDDIARDGFVLDERRPIPPSRWSAVRRFRAARQAGPAPRCESRHRPRKRWNPEGTRADDTYSAECSPPSTPRPARSGSGTSTQ